MKNVQLLLVLALFTLVQVSSLSCNTTEYQDSDTQLNSENNLIHKSRYENPSCKGFERKLFYFRQSRTKIKDTNRDSLQKKKFDSFSKFGNGIHLIWPGNLIQRNSITTGELASIPIGENGRNSIEVKIDAFSSSSTISSSQVIENPTAGRVQSALEIALEGYYSSNTSFPANYSIDVRRAFNSKQLQLALNVGYTGADGVDIGASFGINFSKNKTYYAVTLKQNFFNVSVYPKSSLQGDLGWVKKEYPARVISNYIAQNNPPVYIASVTYGRLYTLVYESDETSFDLEQALNFAYKNPTISLTVSQKLKFNTTLQNARVYVKQLGGNAAAGLLTAFENEAGNFDKIRGFVVNGAEVSKNNPGYPIEYSAAYIGTNQPVTVEVEEKIWYEEEEAIPYLADTYEEARTKIDYLRREYGGGSAAKIIIYNNTNHEIIVRNETAWYGSSFYNMPPSKIPAGKYGFVLAVHKRGEATGTYNQISYVLEDTVLSFGTYVPWSQFRTNNVLVDFKEINEYNLYNKSTRPSIERIQGDIRIKGRIDTGDNPFVFFTIRQ
ncbi:thiol-activated cytolysin family protein [Myroides odoratus]|uniref:thiol-activated cytolysin family protein n=1 Tax=Myroides odoratus TaxID=256 RepID=UPI0039B09FC1